MKPAQADTLSNMCRPDGYFASPSELSFALENCLSSANMVRIDLMKRSNPQVSTRPL